MSKWFLRSLLIMLNIAALILFSFGTMLVITDMYVFKENGIVHNGFITKSTVPDLLKYEPIGTGYDRFKDTRYVVYHMTGTVSTNTITVYDRPPKDLVCTRSILYALFPSLK